MVGCLFVAALFMGAACETISGSTESPLRIYADFVSSSLKSDRHDRRTMRGWAADFQVQQVNITTRYRLDMMRHKEQSFHWAEESVKWQECLQLHKSDIMNSDNTYYRAEGECLRAASADESRKKHAVHQVQKEIKKWRKAYRYLLRRCRADNPGDEVATGECLAGYMKRDNYYETFQRLRALKMESMTSLSTQLHGSAAQLRDCLRGARSQYLSVVRSVADNVHQCYALRNKSPRL